MVGEQVVQIATGLDLVFWYYKENWLQVWVERALLSGMSCGDTPERSLWVSWVWISTSGDLSPTWIFMKSKQYFKRGHWKPCSSDHAEFWESDFQFSSVKLLSHLQFFATPWITARQASPFITNSRSSRRLTSIESVMPSSLQYSFHLRSLIYVVFYFSWLCLSFKHREYSYNCTLMLLSKI